MVAGGRDWEKLVAPGGLKACVQNVCRLCMRLKAGRMVYGSAGDCQYV